MMTNHDIISVLGEVGCVGYIWVGYIYIYIYWGLPVHIRAPTLPHLTPTPLPTPAPPPPVKPRSSEDSQCPSICTIVLCSSILKNKHSLNPEDSLKTQWESAPHAAAAGTATLCKKCLALKKLVEWCL